MHDTLNMDTFLPEFSRYWLAGQPTGSIAPATVAGRADEETPSPAQQEALAALAERITAARSVL